MLLLKYMLLVSGVGMLVTAAAIVANDIWLTVPYRRRTLRGHSAPEPQPSRWRATVLLACLAWAPLLIAISLVVPVATSGVAVEGTQARFSPACHHDH